jgi:hypothetical protein
MDWFRWWHGTVTDPKFQWVARRCGMPLSSVIAVWACLLECASTATQGNADATRGNVASFDCNDYDVLLGFEDGTVEKILLAMSDKKLIDDGRVAGWDGRQPKREDSGNPNTGALSSTERSRIRRENLKRDATQGNEVQRDATQGNDREEEIREEEKKEEPKTKAPRVPRFDAQSHLELLGVDKQVASDWLALRKKKKLESTVTAFDGVLSEAQKAGMSMDQALRTCCTRGWGGFDSTWLSSKANPQASPRNGVQKFDPVAYVNRNRPSENDERTNDYIDV